MRNNIILSVTLFGVFFVIYNLSGLSLAASSQIQKKEQESIYLYMSANLTNPSFLSIDTKNKRIGFRDFSWPYEDCSTQKYYCITNAINFSIPKNLKGIHDKVEWGANGISFSIVRAKLQYDPCNGLQGEAFIVTAENKKRDIEFIYFYSTINGIVSVNIKEKTSKNDEYYFMCAKKMLAVNL